MRGDSTKVWTPRKRQESQKAMLDIGYHNQLLPALSIISLYPHQYAVLSDLIMFNHLINKKCLCFIFIWLLVRLSIILHIFGHNTPFFYLQPSYIFFYYSFCLPSSWFVVLCMFWIEILCYMHCKYLLPECILFFKFIIFTIFCYAEILNFDKIKLPNFCFAHILFYLMKPYIVYIFF